MTAISSWLLSIIGVVIIGSLIDVILPEGSISKYIKSIYSIIIVIVIISPIFQIFDNHFELDNYDNLIDNDFIAQVSAEKINYLENNLEFQFTISGLKNVEVKIDSKNAENSLNIETVYVFFNNLVIEENDEHIDKYQVAEKILINNLKISKEQIIFYE